MVCTTLRFRRPCIQPTYEELKPRSKKDRCFRQNRIQPTYEELKPV